MGIFKALFSNKKVVIGLVIVLAISLPFVINQVLKQQDIRQRAATANAIDFQLTPSTTTVKTGDIFEVKLTMNTNGNDIGSVHYKIRYSKEGLELVSHTPDQSQLSVIKNQATTTATNGYVEVIALNPDSTKRVASSIVPLITLRFKALTAGGKVIDVKEGPLLATATGSDTLVPINNLANIAASVSVTETDTPTPTIAQRTPPCGTYGDVDQNSTITAVDAQYILEHLAGTRTLNAEQVNRADVSADRELGLVDANIIQRYLAGIDNTFPICSVNNVPTPTPTLVCKTGVNSLNVRDVCGTNEYRYMDYGCYDGYSATEGGGTSCKTRELWMTYAIERCSGRTSCSPKYISPTPTPTKPPVACNSACQSPADCQGASGTCTYCNPTTNKCEVPPPIATATPTCPLKPIGDANCDGKVDVVNDFILWKGEFALTTPLSAPKADFDGNGVVNALDFVAWKGGYVDATIPH